MLTTNLSPLLVSAAAEVLESMCFMSVNDSAETPAEVESGWASVKLHFQGQSSGDFGVCTPLATARVMASNFLGEDEPEMNDARAVEVLCEVVNMICGSFLSRIGIESVYDLSHPEPDPDLAQRQSSTLFLTLQVDEGVLCVWMNLEIAP